MNVPRYLLLPALVIALSVATPGCSAQSSPGGTPPVPPPGPAGAAPKLNPSSAQGVPIPSTIR
jgi:hypothetical protein